MNLLQLIDRALSYDWKHNSECVGLHSSIHQQRQITPQLISTNSEGVGDLNTAIGPTLELALPDSIAQAELQQDSDDHQDMQTQPSRRLCQPSTLPAPDPAQLQLEQHLDEERQAASEQLQAQEALDVIISQFLVWEARVTIRDGGRLGSSQQIARVDVGKVRHWSLFQIDSDNPRFQLALTFAEPLACPTPAVCSVLITVALPGSDQKFTVMNQIVSLDTTLSSHHRTEEYAETEATNVKKIFVGSRKQCTLSLSQTKPLVSPAPAQAALFDETSFHTPRREAVLQTSQDDVHVALQSSDAPIQPNSPTELNPCPRNRGLEWSLRDITYHLSVTDLTKCLRPS